MSSKIDPNRIINIPKEVSAANELLAVDSGKIRRASDVSFVDKVIETKRTKGLWTVISMLVDAWAKRTPEDFKAFKIYMQDLRQTRADKKFATTPDKQMERRMIIAFPEQLMYMIRCVYKADELKMDRTFYREFAKRFKFFQVPEKI